MNRMKKHQIKNYSIMRWKKYRACEAIAEDRLPEIKRKAHLSADNSSTGMIDTNELIPSCMGPAVA